jgi:hypothetical protein
MVGLARILPLCALLLVLPAIAASQQAGALFIDRVWTTDGNGNEKTAFSPGDTINYRTFIKNTYNRPANMWILFEAGGPGTAGTPPFRYIYSYIQRDVIVPVSQAGYYSPSTIPADASPGEYFIEIAICWDERSIR